MTSTPIRCRTRSALPFACAITLAACFAWFAASPAHAQRTAKKASQDSNQQRNKDIEVTKIWAQAPHNAFTDLIRWNGRFYCAFREGSGHVPGTKGSDGETRVISSADGAKWQSVAHFKEQGIDLRDPKLSITPGDRLMVLIGGSYYKGTKIQRRLTRVAFLDKEQTDVPKSIPTVIDKKIASPNDWLWRVTWRDGVGYGTVYQANRPERGQFEGPWGFHLVKTTDGVNYQLVKSFDLAGAPGEAAILFRRGGRMMMVVRNLDFMSLGFSAPPYTEWEWKKRPYYLGGPDLIQLPSGAVLLGTRLMKGRDRHTIVGSLTDDGQFTERVRLPSGGDTSYPGMILYEDKLWVSYYSSHEGRTSIYLAKIPLSAFD